MNVELDDIDKALERLQFRLQVLACENRLSIAYSGGLDSRFLAFYAVRCGFEVELLHACAAHVSVTETQQALRKALEIGLPVRLVKPRLPSPQELAQAGRQRCYVCKRAIFSELQHQACAPLCDGSNASDARVFRPGSRAIKELGVHTPLADAGLEKSMIRTAAARLGLSDPQQPARPCLMTRFDYGDAPDERRLLLTQKAEDFLEAMPELAAGFRLRWLGEKALLHVSADNALTMQELQAIAARLGEHLPALKGISVEVMNDLSGWFDRRTSA